MKQAKIISEFNQFLKDKKNPIDQLKQKFGVGLKNDND